MFKQGTMFTTVYIKSKTAVSRLAAIKGQKIDSIIII